MNVLFVCHGNICRSPIAEALLRKKYTEHHIDAEVSSAGFESFNINEAPDPKAQRMAEKYNLDLNHHKARIFLKSDFEIFDKIYVMDTKNYRDVIDLAKTKKDREKVDYLLNVLEPGKNKTMPDPYISGAADLNNIFNLLDQATNEIVELAIQN